MTGPCDSGYSQSWRCTSRIEAEKPEVSSNHGHGSSQDETTLSKVYHRQAVHIRSSSFVVMIVNDYGSFVDLIQAQVGH